MESRQRAGEPASRRAGAAVPPGITCSPAAPVPARQARTHVDGHAVSAVARGGALGGALAVLGMIGGAVGLRGGRAGQRGGSGPGPGPACTPGAAATQAWRLALGSSCPPCRPTPAQGTAHHAALVGKAVVLHVANHVNHVAAVAALSVPAGRGSAVGSVRGGGLLRWRVGAEGAARGAALLLPGCRCPANGVLPHPSTRARRRR